MNIEIVDLETSYPILKDWAKKRNFTTPDKGQLSKFGILVRDEDTEKPLALGWYYPILGSEVCWVGFPFANPDTNKEERGSALNKLFNVLETCAKNDGYKFITTYSATPPVEQRLTQNFNYIKGDTNMNQYWRRL